CKECNRGHKGKFAQVPEKKYLERLYKRNEFLISSHHPLRETLIQQTGGTPELRQAFLNEMDKFAIELLLHRWKAEKEFELMF
ncbi:MAG: HNH endonuclease, partial [Candidatus Ornithomonoglobus sp.]